MLFDFSSSRRSRFHIPHRRLPHPHPHIRLPSHHHGPTDSAATTPTETQPLGELPVIPPQTDGPPSHQGSDSIRSNRSARSARSLRTGNGTGAGAGRRRSSVGSALSTVRSVCPCVFCHKAAEASGWRRATVSDPTDCSGDGRWRTSSYEASVRVRREDPDGYGGTERGVMLDVGNGGGYGRYLDGGREEGEEEVDPCGRSSYSGMTREGDSGEQRRDSGVATTARNSRSASLAPSDAHASRNGRRGIGVMLAEETSPPRGRSRRRSTHVTASTHRSHHTPITPRPRSRHDSAHKPGFPPKTPSYTEGHPLALHLPTRSTTISLPPPTSPPRPPQIRQQTPLELQTLQSYSQPSLPRSLTLDGDLIFPPPPSLALYSLNHALSPAGREIVLRRCVPRLDVSSAGGLPANVASTDRDLYLIRRDAVSASQFQILGRRRSTFPAPLRLRLEWSVLGGHSWICEAAKTKEVILFSAGEAWVDGLWQIIGEEPGGVVMSRRELRRRREVEARRREGEKVDGEEGGRTLWLRGPGRGATAAVWPVPEDLPREDGSPVEEEDEIVDGMVDEAGETPTPLPGVELAAEDPPDPQVYRDRHGSALEGPIELDSPNPLSQPIDPRHLPTSHRPFPAHNHPSYPSRPSDNQPEPQQRERRRAERRHSSNSTDDLDAEGRERIRDLLVACWVAKEWYNVRMAAMVPASGMKSVKRSWRWRTQLGAGSLFF